MSASTSDLAAARQKLHALGSKGKRDFKCMNAYLRLVRELGVRESEGVAEYGSAVLTNFRSRLQEDERTLRPAPPWCPTLVTAFRSPAGSLSALTCRNSVALLNYCKRVLDQIVNQSTRTVWQLHEDVAIAAADTGCLTLAQQCVDAVNKNFPSSIRAQRLKGMLLEASGSIDAAKAFYDKLLEENPDNAVIWKRKVALLMTSGDVMGAIEELVAYLDVFQTDRQAWEQLCDLYLQAKLIDQARFCIEEVLLHGPDLRNLIKLADMLYAQSGAANLESALGYYCKVIELSKGENARGLYGALGTVCELAAIKGHRKDHSEIATLAAQKLIKSYENKAPEHLEHVKALLAAQDIVL